jgi:hypothetical protein
MEGERAAEHLGLWTTCTEPDFCYEPRRITAVAVVGYSSTAVQYLYSIGTGYGSSSIVLVPGYWVLEYSSLVPGALCPVAGRRAGEGTQLAIVFRGRVQYPARASRYPVYPGSENLAAQKRQCIVKRVS